MRPLVNHVLAGTSHVLDDERVATALDRLYLAGQRAADAARGTGEVGDFGFGCSPAQGELLYLWCRGSGARTAVQAVSSGGATAVYLAAAVRDNGGGIVLTCDDRPERAEATRRTLDDAGLAPWVDVSCGDPATTLPPKLGELTAPVDVLALDGWPDLAPPSRALRVLEAVRPYLRAGALVLNDGGEPDYLHHVRLRANGLRTSVLDVGAVSVVA